MRIEAEAAFDPAAAPSRAGEIVIGLVNIMPEKARPATDQQFQALLEGVPAGRQVRLRRFGPDHAGVLGQENLAALWGSRLHGLIVTGTEPQAETIAGEPSWPLLSRLVDWAGENTLSAIWSCFSAHAAVYALDGIARRRLPQKISGVFDCTSARPGAAAARLPVPHSRHNTLEEEALADHGYTILSRSPRLGADAFSRRHGRSRFLFLQGHPEYGPRALLNEYSRDLRRFLAGAQPVYPELPVNYVEPATAAAFSDLRARAERAPCPGLADRFDWSAVRLRPPAWQEAARRLVGGWIAGLATRLPAGAAR